jgi:DNA invertase Pin-like site-specific DNA recombinase
VALEKAFESVRMSKIQTFSDEGGFCTIYIKDTGISGTTSSRPGLNELMKDCRRRAIDVVVVWKFDDLSPGRGSFRSALFS